ncbi:hypothetical protein D9M68_497140 [compost metagenome]
MQRNLADLIEEQCAARGAFYIAALAALQGAGEGAALVAEHLRLEQGFRDAAAVDVDEGAVAPAGGAVDMPGDGRLADAGLAEQ